MEIEAWIWRQVCEIPPGFGPTQETIGSLTGEKKSILSQGVTLATSVVGVIWVTGVEEVFLAENTWMMPLDNRAREL